MTPRDPFPIGKHKGLSLTEVKAKHPDYVTWICDQDWFEEKYPEIYEYFQTGVTFTKPAEKAVMDSDDELLDPMSDAFKRFWKLQYGQRMRTQGQLHYTAYLRVATTTWNACLESLGKLDLPKPKPPLNPLLSTPLDGKPQMLPPPLSHIPAPKLALGSNKDDPKTIEDEDNPTPDF